MARASTGSSAGLVRGSNRRAYCLVGDGDCNGVGWDAREVDGHDHEAILAAPDGLEPHGKPRAVIARTTFGGVSFMAGRIEWHYLPLTEEQYPEAMDELDRAAEHGWI